MLDKSEIRSTNTETNPNDQNSRFDHLNFVLVSYFEIRISCFYRFQKRQELLKFSALYGGLNLHPHKAAYSFTAFSIRG